MSDPRFLREGVNFNAAHAAEEAGELVAALGKLLRWGPESYNPNLPPGQREKNIDWVRRENADLQAALARLETEIIRERNARFRGAQDAGHERDTGDRSFPRPTPEDGGAG